MAVEPASLSQAQSVRRLSRREPYPRRRRRIRQSRRQRDKLLSRIDLHPRNTSRGVGAPRPANNFGFGHGSETRNSCTWRARPDQPLRPVSIAPHVRPAGLPAGVIAERLGVQPSAPSFHLATRPCRPDHSALPEPAAHLIGLRVRRFNDGFGSRAVKLRVSICSPNCPR